MISAVGNLHGRIATGSIIVNDYVIELTPIENGYTLTVTRGSEVQTMTLYGVSDELLEQVLTAAQTAVNAMTSAGDYAASSETAKNAAETASSDAQGFSNAAAQSASEAASSASEAASSAETATYAAAQAVQRAYALTVDGSTIAFSHGGDR